MRAVEYLEPVLLIAMGLLLISVGWPSSQRIVGPFGERQSDPGPTFVRIQKGMGFIIAVLFLAAGLAKGIGLLF